VDIITALCIINYGWSEDWEHSIFIEARKVVGQHAQRYYLEQQQKMIAKRLEKLDNKENPHDF
jgi:hypothetical protein